MIKNFFIIYKKWVIVLVIIAIVIPVVVFSSGSIYKKNTTDNTVVLPTEKPPFPTFPDAPRAEGELIIQYAEGQEFINLEKIRQQEITVFLEQNGVISQEKAYDVDDGPLSRSYFLRLREGVDVEEAARKIYELPEVNNAQPNTEVGLF